MRGATTLLLDAYRRYWFFFSPTRTMVRRNVLRFFAHRAVNGPVLEVGAGTGMMVPTLRRACRTAMVVRSDLEATDRTDVVCDGRHLPFADATFSTVAAFEVLEHVGDTSSFLTELRRVSDPTGHIVVSVPFLLGRHDHEDFYRFTPAGLKHVLADSGWSVVALHCSGGVAFATVNLICEYLRTVGVADARGWRSDDRSRRTQLAVRTILTVPVVALSWVAIGIDRIIDPRPDGPSTILAIASSSSPGAP